MVNAVNKIGFYTLLFMENVGKIALFSARTIYAVFTPTFYGREFSKQMLNIGYNSLPVVGLTAIFTGMVLALQSYTGFSRFAVESALPIVVILSITRELAPVLAGLMIAGRVGAAIAAEIGTMRVTEQIDALVILATNPIKYLVVPRVLAGMIVLPLLVLVADVIGVMGGYLVAVYKLDFNYSAYLKQSAQYLELQDVIFGLVKASVFGFIVTIMGCYSGYCSGKGAQGVGNATTKAVVSSSILILIANYLLTILFFDNNI